MDERAFFFSIANAKHRYSPRVSFAARTRTRWVRQLPMLRVNEPLCVSNAAVR
jgi:hypothetical protein